MIFASEKMAYDGEKYTTPVWQLNTDTYTVTHTDDTGVEERTPYHSECVRYYINYCLENNSDKLEKLVNDGKIKVYLEELETKFYEAVDRQVSIWKAQDRDYQATLASGDFLTQAKMENTFDMQAKELLYSTMVYS